MAAHLIKGTHLSDAVGKLRLGKGWTLGAEGGQHGAAAGDGRHLSLEWKQKCKANQEKPI